MLGLGTQAGVPREAPPGPPGRRSPAKPGLSVCLAGGHPVLEVTTGTLTNASAISVCHLIGSVKKPT